VEELLARLIALVGSQAALGLLQRAVAAVEGGASPLRACYRPFVTDPFDADELGIYDDELEGECRG